MAFAPPFQRFRIDSVPAKYKISLVFDTRYVEIPKFFFRIGQDWTSLDIPDIKIIQSQPPSWLRRINRFPFGLAHWDDPVEIEVDLDVVRDAGGAIRNPQIIAMRRRKNAVSVENMNVLHTTQKPALYNLVLAPTFGCTPVWHSFPAAVCDCPRPNSTGSLH